MTRTVPEVAFVRVLTPGGPYRVGETLSVAFVSPDVGRLAAHGARATSDPPSACADVVPETISVSVERSAGPFAAGASLTLSFIDPAIARIHVTNSDVRRERDPSHDDIRTIGETVARETVASLLVAAPAVSLAGRVRGARVRLDWNRDRVRRFVQVVDKLFTVDRLGWYRHVFAMRLLVPDTIDCGDSQTDVEALRHLHALRAASIETLGRPLLAAFMPNFSVTAEWLDSLEKPAAARALGGLREALLPYAGDDAVGPEECEPTWTIASIAKDDLASATSSSVEALLPIFIPYRSSLPDLTDAISAYRSTLVDIFGRTAQPADAVRLHQMAEPNLALDDRLRHVSHALTSAFADLVVA